MILTLRALPLFFVVTVIASLPLSGLLAQPADDGGQDALATMASNQERIGRLIETLKDDESRANLIEQLEVLAEADATINEPAVQPVLPPASVVIDQMGGGAVRILANEIAVIRDRVTDIAKSLSNIPEFLSWLKGQLAQGQVRSDILRAVIELMITLGAGVLAARGVTWLSSSIWPDRDGDEGRDMTSVVTRALGRIILASFSLAVFAAISYAALVIVSKGPVVRQIAIALVLYVSIRLVVGFIIGEMVRPRYVRISKDACLGLARWLRRVASVSVFGYLIVITVTRLGLPDHLVGLVSNVLGLVVLFLVLRLIFSTGSAVSGSLVKATGPLSVIAHILGRIWVLLASVYSVSLFVIWSLGVEEFSHFAVASLASFVAIAAALLIDVLIQRAGHAPTLNNKTDDGSASAEGGQDHEGSSRTHGQSQSAGMVVNSAWQRARWPSRLLIAAIAILLVVQFWGLDVVGWARGGPGQALVGTFLNIALVCIVALVVWDILRRGIETWLAAPEHGGTGAQRTQRARTLLPLLRTGLGFMLGTVVLLAILAELGINIAPLLAGAGVVGLAVGFGSQALVKDVISGAFMLAENTLSVGDVVRLGSHAGVVEALTIRSVRLRDLSGTVHTIPLGEITAVENMTKDFSYYLMDIGVSYDADVDEVIEVLNTLGAELRENPELGWDILEPLEVLGVDQFADSAVIIKARIKTVPLRQWAVGREFNRLMKKRFDELGIGIPYPQVTISYEKPQPSGTVSSDNLATLTAAEASSSEASAG